MEWSDDYLRARIASESQYTRHSGGSPDPLEIALYEQLVTQLDQQHVACCLGMTPELRSMLAKHFTQLRSIDCSQAAIKCYSSWIGAEEAEKEKLVESEWMPYLESLQANSIDCIAGDGILGNLPSESAAVDLLLAIRRALRPSGVFVMRSLTMPTKTPTWQDLREAYRSGKICPNSFGLATRLLGHCDQFYDSNAGILDNQKVFAECDRQHASGELSEVEIRLIRRFLFLGFNWIPSETRWNQLLASLPFSTEIHTLEGRHWYEYYKIYSMRPL